MAVYLSDAVLVADVKNRQRWLEGLADDATAHSRNSGTQLNARDPDDFYALTTLQTARSVKCVVQLIVSNSKHLC